MTDTARLTALRDTYKNGLLGDTLPFWMRHAPDREHGGFITCLNRDGSIVDTDKGIWPQGRFTWLLAHLYNTVEQRSEWLELARHGIDFIERAGFDTDGRMFFQVDREGRPLRKRRYAYSESFAAIAYGEMARATGKDEYAAKAIRLHGQYIADALEGKRGAPKVNAETRPMQGIGAYMILINTSQMLRESIDAPGMTGWIDRSIEKIRTDFMKPEMRVVLETTGPGGAFIDHADGRTLNPGHAIEAAWFVMEEARLRGGDGDLLAMGRTILDWMWERGWDKEYGGLLYFADAKGLPVQEYWHDMKFWWPHNEAIIATLLAWEMTGDAKYAEWAKMVHDWSYAHFPDPEYGEWYGYLHRDGRISSPVKGSLWKGPFHLPRMELICWRICERMLARA